MVDPYLYPNSDVLKVAHIQLLGLKISKSTYAKIETNRMNIKVSELVALKIIFENILRWE